MHQRYWYGSRLTTSRLGIFFHYYYYFSVILTYYYSSFRCFPSTWKKRDILFFPKIRYGWQSYSPYRLHHWRASRWPCLWVCSVACRSRRTGTGRERHGGQSRPWNSLGSCTQQTGVGTGAQRWRQIGPFGTWSGISSTRCTSGIQAPWRSSCSRSTWWCERMCSRERRTCCGHLQGRKMESCLMMKSYMVDFTDDSMRYFTNGINKISFLNY